MLRNKEFKYASIIFCVISAVIVILEFKINTLAGIIAFGGTLIIGILFLVFTRARYKKIADLSYEIDNVLNNDEHLYIADQEEGELSILQSEITKMTLRIREQNKALKVEKEHLGNSMADIAHQLRTPLTSVNIILSLLENSHDEKERRSLIRETKGLFIQMDWLLTSLLKLSRIDAGIVVFERKDIEVNELVDRALKPFLLSMELHNIVPKIDVHKEIVIKGDALWLSEAIQNIIKNSMESVGDNGVIKISCSDNPLFIEIKIHDSGKGFEKEDLPHLFERFYRGKNSNATGYGIGLALCKMIIAGQGGSITAKNHKEGGAVFSVRFPK